jgi:DNA helicase-2/ATP-dependent DNA helicase PcrA
MQTRIQDRPVSQPKDSRNQVIDLKAVSSHTVGERVFHQKFGYGEVLSIEGDKLEIAFEKAGTKKVIAKFISGADDIPF